MAGAFLSRDSAAAIYMKNWALNYLENAGPDGRVAGCITPQGPDDRLFSMKPLLAQGVHIASTALGDWSWISPWFSTLKGVVMFRENYCWDPSRNLGMWYDSMESGADNNLAYVSYPPRTVLSPDLNAFLYREYRAMAIIASRLGLGEEASSFQDRAEKLLQAVNQHLWNDTDGIYYHVEAATGAPIRRVAYSCFIPFWAGLGSHQQASRSFGAYLLAPEHMQTKYGFRSHSKADPEYNNVNMIKPHSNWQGPVWPIANYLFIHALQHYGYHQEALESSIKNATLLCNDIATSGGMHENYDAETGLPLAAPGFISWNILHFNLIDEILTGRDPFSLAA
jgi:alpha,alpha-trehalase